MKLSMCLIDKCTQLEAAETLSGYVVEGVVLETGSKDSWDLPDSVNVYHTALFLREKLLSVKSTLPFPPTTSNSSAQGGSGTLGYAVAMLKIFLFHRLV